MKKNILLLATFGFIANAQAADLEPKVKVQIFKDAHAGTHEEKANQFAQFLVPSRYEALNYIVEKGQDKKEATKFTIAGKTIIVTNHTIQKLVGLGAFAAYDALKTDRDLKKSALAVVTGLVVDQAIQKARGYIDPVLHTAVAALPIPDVIKKHALAQYIANKSVDGAMEHVGSLAFNRAKTMVNNQKQQQQSPKQDHTERPE